MASGWNLWVWLQCIGVASRCCCKEVYRYCTEVWMTILESGWNLWVWLVGVVSRRWVWLVGGIYGYGYNV